MDLTEDTLEKKKARSKKMMLWFGIVSMVMTFAGLTSAYVVSSSRPDWVSDYELPVYFWYSTIVIIASSITMFLAHRSLMSENRRNAGALLIGTLILGFLFVTLQFYGFSQIMEQGYFFTGPVSSVTMSFIYLIVFLHMVHLGAGMIVLFVLIYNHFKQRYKPGQMLGFELGATFWHFVDVLWILLILFFYFYR